MLASGTMNAHNEYLFDPGTSARAAVFWIRLLENKWTTDFWPGGYGPSARQRLNAGKPLTPDRMFDLVTVSYNRGYIEVKALVDRYGPRLDRAPLRAHRVAERRRRIISSACGRTRGCCREIATRGASALIVCNFSPRASRTTSAGPEPARTTSTHRHAKK